jgi:hypothetical protein
VQEARSWLAQTEPVDDLRGREPVQGAQASGHAALGDRRRRSHPRRSYRYSL